MSEDFKAVLRRMIDEEPARKAALQTADALRSQNTLNQQRVIDELQPAIAGRVQYVSSLLGDMAGHINEVSGELGFSADVSASGQPGQSLLMLNIHGPQVAPLRITINRVGDVFFDPGYEPTFNILRSDDTPIVNAVTKFVQNTYRILFERKPS